MSRKYPKVEHFLVCDDIRKETNNKTSVMGIYGQGTVLTIPTVLPRLCFYLTFTGVMDGDKITIQLRDPKDEILKQLDTPEFNIPRKEGEDVVLHMIFSGVQISQEGLYTLVTKLVGTEKGKQALEFTLRKRT